MKIYSTTSMVDIETNCKKENADLLLLGAGPIKLDEFKNLKYIFRAGIGCENIPTEEIGRIGFVELFFPSQSTRDVISNAVADFTYSLILSENILLRTAENWDRRPRESKKSLCIIGLGNIGSKVFHALKQSTGAACGYDIMNDNEFDHHYCDLYSFHVPLKHYVPGTIYKDNRNLISKDFLEKIPKNSTIINTSRGGIANEYDIMCWLKDNPYAKYITDVYSKEPYTQESHLSKFVGTQVYGTPHIASYTVNVKKALTSDALALIERLKI